MAIQSVPQLKQKVRDIVNNLKIKTHLLIPASLKKKKEKLLKVK